jgi:hypothetical protein
MRLLLVAILVGHGLIHLMGFAKAFGLAALPQLTVPISKPVGALWLLAALGMFVSATVPPRVFWMVGLAAVVLSEGVILASWRDARFGTIVNVVLLLAVVYSFGAHGPLSLRAAYAADLTDVRDRVALTELVTEADLAALPEPVRRYLRVTGSVGRPRVANLHVRWRGRIRGAANDPWMAFTAEQHSTFGPSPTRLFFMDATMRGLPVDIYHRFLGGAATFRVRALSLFPMVDAAGPEMNRSETVTLFNDLCVLAPPALLDRSIRWAPVSVHTARGVFTRGAETVSAVLEFNDAGELVDFVSDDRSSASPDGKRFTLTRWSTPLRDYRVYDGRRLASRGVARWYAPSGVFNYIELELTEVAFNVTP